MRDTFSGYHPTINFLYFALVLVFCMTLTHPASQAISLACALCYAVQTGGRKAVKFALKIALPILLVAAFVNPAFNHAGRTILCYLPTGNPLTLESILYGLSAGCMLATTLLWFSSFNVVFTSDKFIYLFGRVIPALSLVLSMTLRFVPKFKSQLDVVNEAQRCVGRDTGTGSIWQRTKNAIKVLSIMITWALENAIETADSMKSRGYGLKGRTAFSIYRFDERDRMALIWLTFCGAFVLFGSIAGGLAFRYFPDIRMAPVNAMTACFQVVYFALCITPVILNGREDRKWKSLRSAM